MPHHPPATQPARPPCPYCGERQAYDEARPSRPVIITEQAYDPRRPVGHRWHNVKRTTWNTECRACGRRITWSILLGTLTARGVKRAPLPAPEWLRS